MSMSINRTNNGKTGSMPGFLLEFRRFGLAVTRPCRYSNGLQYPVENLVPLIGPGMVDLFLVGMGMLGIMPHVHKLDCKIKKKAIFMHFSGSS